MLFLTGHFIFTSHSQPLVVSIKIGYLDKKNFARMFLQYLTIKFSPPFNALAIFHNISDGLIGLNRIFTLDGHENTFNFKKVNALVCAADVIKYTLCAKIFYAIYLDIIII